MKLLRHGDASVCIYETADWSVSAGEPERREPVVFCCYGTVSSAFCCCCCEAYLAGRGEYVAVE